MHQSDKTVRGLWTLKTGVALYKTSAVEHAQASWGISALPMVQLPDFSLLTFFLQTVAILAFALGALLHPPHRYIQQGWMQR